MGHDPREPGEAGQQTDRFEPGEAQESVGRDPSATPLGTSFGTAIGAAMMGFEQAIRSEPPAEVMAAEHMPARGQVGLDGEVVLEFPEHVDEPAERADRRTREPS